MDVINTIQHWLKDPAVGKLIQLGIGINDSSAKSGSNRPFTQLLLDGSKEPKAIAYPN